MKRKIACIADTHCASNFGLCPPQWRNPEGNIVTHNKGQKVVWDHWLKFISICRRQKIDTVILDGDLVHGQNPKQGGIQNYTNDMEEQAELAEEVLQPLMDIPTVKHRHFLQGSGYHVDEKGRPIERGICRYFKGTWHGFIANIHFKGTNIKAHIIHGGSGAWMYRSQVLDRRNMLMNAAAGVGTLPKFNIMIRAHWHYYQYIDMNGQHIVQLPCWCLFIPAQITTERYPQYQPAIGGVIITIDDDDTVDVNKYLLPYDKIPKVRHEVKKG